MLLSRPAAPATAAAPLEVADDPCWVLLSSTGLLARTSSADPLPVGPASGSQHDVVSAAVRATARGEVGLVTSRGRLVRLVRRSTCPPCRRPAAPPSLSGGAPLGGVRRPPARARRSLGLDDAVDAGSAGLALGTAQRRRQAGGARLPGQPRRLRGDRASSDGDEVVGAVELADGEEDLVLHHLRRASCCASGAASVRPQGRPAGGHGRHQARGRAAVVVLRAPSTRPADNVVVTIVRARPASLPGTEPGSVKVTPYAEYPAKGRATGGVRCHRFLKGEDELILAWAGPAPARAASGSGVPVELPDATGRRDGSGTPGDHSRRCGGRPDGRSRAPALTCLLVSGLPASACSLSTAAAGEPAYGSAAPAQRLGRARAARPVGS